MSKQMISLAFALVACFACTDSFAQIVPPRDSFVQIVPPPDAPAPELADDAKTRAQIVEALRNAKAARDAGQTIEPGNTGNMVLDDVLEIIRRRGSVLDGSSLDPANDDAPLIITLPLEPSDGREPLGGRESLSGDVPAASAVYDAAEQLLRSARLLEKLSRAGDLPIDEDRAMLIRSMRGQAGRLLIQAIAREAESVTPAATSPR
jgi:hypothetical protein